MDNSLKYQAVYLSKRTLKVILDNLQYKIQDDDYKQIRNAYGYILDEEFVEKNAQKIKLPF